MTTQVEATLINGVLKPDQPLSLPDQTRVRLTIESIDPIAEWSPEKAQAAWEAIQARLKERPIHGGGVHYSRDELHERR
jgi:predicted DNA-binding antitoxin AbrB/MazE fold protein